MSSASPTPTGTSKGETNGKKSKKKPSKKSKDDKVAPVVEVAREEVEEEEEEGKKKRSKGDKVRKHCSAVAWKTSGLTGGVSFF